MIRRIQLDVFQKGFLRFMVGNGHDGKRRCSGQKFISCETSPGRVRGEHFPLRVNGLLVGSLFGDTFYNGLIRL